MSIPGYGFDFQDMEDDNEPGHEVEAETFDWGAVVVVVLVSTACVFAWWSSQR